MNPLEILNDSNKFKITLGLDRVKKVLKAFDNPEKKVKYIHVAGTNGKGSVCAIIEAVLLAKGGLKVGKYTSPHLFSYEERFSVNGSNIETTEFYKLVETVCKKDAALGVGLSQFELLTVVCFLYFAKNNVDIGILETGLGGALDATNVIENPLISIITSVSMDHTERLGDTIEKIAKEKAGIIKPEKKCLFLPANKGYKTLRQEALKKNAVIVSSDIDLKVSNNSAFINGERFEFALNGDFQEENLKLALLGAQAALGVTFEKDVLKTALSKVKWRFRMETVDFGGNKLLLDGCHNPDGARVLNDYLETYCKDKKIKFIFGCLENKDYKNILKTLYKKEYDFCFYEFDCPNALKFEALKTDKIRKINNPLVEINKGDYDLCVVSGSLYMLGAIFKNA